MARVTPSSDNGYNYYQQRAGELEDEYEARKQKVDSKEEELRAHLQKTSKQNHDSLQTETEQAIADVKKRANEAITRERNNGRVVLENLKRQTYNQTGRYNGMEAESLKQAYDSATKGWKQSEKASKHKYDTLEKRSMNKADRRERDHAHELEKVVNDTRASAADAVERSSGAQKESYHQLRDEAQKLAESTARRSEEDKSALLRQNQSALNDSKQDFERQAGRLQSSNNTKQLDRERRFDAELLDNTRRMNDAHSAETATLRGNIKELNEVNPEYYRQRSDGRQEAIKEFEVERKTELDAVVRSYDDQIDSLKHNMDAIETHMGAKNRENLDEKDRTHSALIGRTNNENFLDKKETVSIYENNRTQQEQRIEREREQAAARFTRAVQSSDERMSNALEKQAKTFQENGRVAREGSDEEKRALRATLDMKLNSTDPTDVNNAQDAAIRRSAAVEYDKLLTTERERNKHAQESIQRNYGERASDAIEEARVKETKIQQQNASDRHQEQSELLAHVQDTELMKDAAIRQRDSEHQREVENLSRASAKNMEYQRRQYEEVLQITRSEANAKLQGARQQHEFDSKMTARSYSTRQNELIRDYEKRMANQKTDYDELLGEVKAQAESGTRESDRKLKHGLEEQARLYEQKIAQLEDQQKERERIVEQNHQEGLERLKRTHELQFKKRT